MEKERYKRSVKVHNTSVTIYKAYKKENIYEDFMPTQTQFVQICTQFNKIVSDKIIKESFEFKVPFNLGYLRIKKTPFKIRIKDGQIEKNKMIVDWGATWKYWNEEYPGLSRKEVWEIPGKIPIYQLNDHTDGFVMKWYWDKRTSNIKNRTVYQFKPIKANRLNLGAWIKSDERTNDYYL